LNESSKLLEIFSKQEEDRRESQFSGDVGGSNNIAGLEDSPEQ